MIPVIIFHIGNQKYLHDCINSAIKHDNTVNILNDNPDNFQQSEKLTVCKYNEYSTY